MDEALVRRGATAVAPERGAAEVLLAQGESPRVNFDFAPFRALAESMGTTEQVR